MSTTIYNGIKFATNDLVEIHEHFMEWRKRVDTLAKEAEGKYIANRVTDEIDNACFYDRPMDNFLSKVVNDMMDAQREIKKTGRRNPAIDFEFSCSILPHQGKVYGMVFCDQPDWRNEFMELPWVQEFWYWNNTDPPEPTDLPVIAPFDSVQAVYTETAWEGRGQVWDAILDRTNDSRPSANGFAAECSPPDRWPDHTTAIAQIASFDKRVEAMARRATLNRKCMELRPTDDEKNPGFGYFYEATSYVKSEEGLAETEANKVIARERLIPVLDYGVLVNRPGEPDHALPKS